LCQAGVDPSLDPQISADSRNRLDFEICIEDRRYLIEVFVPRMSQEMEALFSTGWAGFIDPNRDFDPRNEGNYSRLESVIFDEINDHFNGADPDSIQSTVILIMKTTFAYPQISPGSQLILHSPLPSYIGGILRYDSRLSLSSFHTNPLHSLPRSDREFFAQLFYSS
ncbi:MAG: hypothetical protein ABFD77_08585, partial [Thermotogota bacterium]